MDAELTSQERAFWKLKHLPETAEQAPIGRKDDTGKILAGVLLDFAHALELVAEVGTMGAKKYQRGNWRHVENGVERYMDAAFRHLLAHGKGELTDPESGLPHLGHAVWSLLAVIELGARDAN